MSTLDGQDSDDMTGALLDYINARYAPEDDVLRELLTAARAEELPSIQVSPALGKLLALLVRISGARRVLEIGTLAGYSSIWLGRALPENGTLITLEIDPHHAAVARRFIAQAGLAEKIEVRLGPALQTLEYLAGGLPFDMAFIDANKESYPAYLDWALRLVRPGGVIVADNVVRDGAVLQTASDDTAIQAIQEYNDRVSRDPRLDGVILLTRNGGGNRDGVSVAWVRDDVDLSDDLYHRE
jgi:predicted O-methyltransferase YrrM